MNFTEEQILTLAPDEGSRKAGRDLAKPHKWVTRGAAERALWGECQGSGSKPYQTAIDLSNIAFKCSCPSRKFPCKHGVALGILYVRHSHDFAAGNPPPWVTEWLDKRVQKGGKGEDKGEKVVDAAARQKRQQAREAKVAGGVEDLIVWMGDMVRNGIINLPDKGPSFWEGAARRMVDAQAPGLASMIRSLGATPFFRDGWQSAFLEGLLNLYLVAKGYQNRKSLDPLTLQEVRTAIGFPVSAEDLKSQEGVRDTWLVAGKQTTEEDNLTVERSWLYGINSNRYALILQFLPRGAAPAVLLSRGMYIDAELAFYPAAVPLRAVVKEHVATTSRMPRQWISTWKEVAAAESAACSLFPLKSERPYLMDGLVPLLYNGEWWLRDRNEDLVALPRNFAALWKLLALSGGTPLNMIVLGKGGMFEPLGVWEGETYKIM